VVTESSELELVDVVDLGGRGSALASALRLR